VQLSLCAAHSLTVIRFAPDIRQPRGWQRFARISLVADPIE